MRPRSPQVGGGGADTWPRSLRLGCPGRRPVEGTAAGAGNRLASIPLGV